MLSLGKNGNKEVHGAATKTTSQFIGSLWSPAAWKIPTWLQTHNYLLVGTDYEMCNTKWKRRLFAFMSKLKCAGFGRKAQLLL